MFVLSALPVAISLAAWFTPAAATVQPVCSNSTLSKFKLNALFTEPALNVDLPADGFPITVSVDNITSLDEDNFTFFSVLSRNDSRLPLVSYKLNNGALEVTDSFSHRVSENLHVNPGNSPAFKGGVDKSTGPNEWCAMRTDSKTEPRGRTLPPLQLAVQNTPGLFSICTNSTAGGRQDLVFQQGATFEPSISDCKKVTLFPIPL